MLQADTPHVGAVSNIVRKHIPLSDNPWQLKIYKLDICDDECMHFPEQSDWCYNMLINALYRIARNIGGFLNSVVWPQADCKKFLVEFQFGSGISSSFIKERYRLSLEVLEQTHEFANLQEIKLAAC